MRGFFGFLPKLQEQVESLPRDVLDRVNRSGGIGFLSLFDLILHPQDHTVFMPEDPEIESILTMEEDLSHVGYEAIKDGRAGLCVISDHVIEDEKLINSYFCKLSAKHLPFQKIWSISPSQRGYIMPNVTSLANYESIRLTPDNLLPEEGVNLLHSCGSGDFISLLKTSGELDRFVDEGGKYLVIIDLDSGFQGFDPRILDKHIMNNSPITCSITEKLQGDSGSLLCHTAGFNQLVEQFRFSSRIESSHLAWTFGGTMILSADIDFNSVPLPWHRRKKIADKRLVIQHERYMSDLTSSFKTQFVKIPRTMLL